MKKLVLPILMLAALVLCVSALGACGDEVPTGAIATVGDGVVTRAELDDVMARYKAEADAQAGQPGATPFPSPGTPEYDKLAAGVIRNLVTEELVRQEAQSRGLSVSEAELDEAATLAAVGEGSQKALDDRLEQLGMDRGGLRVFLATNIILNKLREGMAGSMAPTEEDIRAYYDAHRADYMEPEGRKTRHILVDDRALAGELYRTLSADPGDANWKKLAKRYTQDTGGRLIGGDIAGYVTRGQMVKPFEVAVFAADEGEVVGPVKTKYGWHVIQVTEVRPEVEPDFAKVAPEIAEMLFEQEVEGYWQSWLEDGFARVDYAPGYDPDELAPPSPAPGASIQP